MSSNPKNEIRDVFDLLTEKQFRVKGDPELAALHVQASRHFGAAVDYYDEDSSSYNLEYELQQVRNTLDRFNDVRSIDKEPSF